jgi:hypothetical protein
MPEGGRLPAFGLSLRPPSGMGIGWAFCASMGRLCMIHVVLHDNNTAVLKESPGWCLNFIRDLQSNFLRDLRSKITVQFHGEKRAPPTTNHATNAASFPRTNIYKKEKRATFPFSATLGGDSFTSVRLRDKNSGATDAG